jgi:myosin heavy subunit
VENRKIVVSQSSRSWFKIGYSAPATDSQSGSARPNEGRDDDGLWFNQLKIALKSIGFSKWHVAQTCQLVAAILHLGNLKFTIDGSRNEDAAVVRNVADFLRIQLQFHIRQRC